MALWNSISHVVRSMSARDERRPGQVSGRFAVATAEDLAALQDCLRNFEETRAQVDDIEDPSLLTQSKTYAVTLAPRLGLGVIVADLATVLRVPRARVKAPENFYLLADNLSSSDAAAADSPVARYRLALEFIAFLQKVAAFLDPERQQLVFIDAGKFEIPVEYDVAKLTAMLTDDIRALLVAIPKGIHEGQCGAIMASAVVALVRTIQASDRFGHLLLNAGDLKKRYDEGYNLFASGFSYDKVRDQVEAARVEYAGKIHKAFGDIQNQLLGIPVATVVVATQMKMATTWGYEFWLNTSVLVGVWVFAILIWLLLRNQGHTLDVLGDEIKRQGSLIEKQYKDVAASFAGVFEFLNKRLRRQRRVMSVIDATVAVGLVLAHAVYFALTPVAFDWLKAHVFH